MDLTKKQEEIKAKVLDGSHVLATGKLKGTDKANEVLNGIYPYGPTANFSFYGMNEYGNFIFLAYDELNNRPIIDMSEWFEDEKAGIKTNILSEDTEIESIRQFQGSREYDESFLQDWFDFYYGDHYNVLNAHIDTFLSKRYPNTKLLKRKEELEKELKEIEEKLKL